MKIIKSLFKKKKCQKGKKRGIIRDAINQKMIFSGVPTLRKSENLNCPTLYIIVFVWYPTGVIKLAEEPNIIAIKKGRGSTPIIIAAFIAIGARRTAVALFDIDSVSNDVSK